MRESKDSFRIDLTMGTIMQSLVGEVYGDELEPLDSGEFTFA
jgi:hypothetical protein